MKDPFFEKVGDVNENLQKPFFLNILKNPLFLKKKPELTFYIPFFLKENIKANTISQGNQNICLELTY